MPALGSDEWRSDRQGSLRRMRAKKAQQVPALVTAPDPDVGHGCVADPLLPPVRGLCSPPHEKARHAPDSNQTRSRPAGQGGMGNEYRRGASVATRPASELTVGTYGSPDAPRCAAWHTGPCSLGRISR